MECLDFLRQSRGLRPPLTTNLVLGVSVSLPDFHDVDVLRRARFDADELSADSVAGSLELVALVRGNGERLCILVAEAERHRHRGEGFTGA